MTKRILIVEDEFVVANGLRLVLEQAGYDVNGIARSAEEADRLIRLQRPDLVLLDIRLDGKRTGIDLAKNLKRDNIAFIYLSANSSQKVLEEAKATEPYGFLVKPFREKDLLIMLDIAWYRHENSLESRLKQDENFQKRLLAITAEDTDEQTKMLQLGRLFQTQVPFDLLLSVNRTIKSSNSINAAFLRIGLDEYQSLGNAEMANITGNKVDLFDRIANLENKDIDTACFHHTLPSDGNTVVALDKLLYDAFKVQSYLVLPVVAGDGINSTYYFFSRQKEVYTQKHIDLLSRIKQHLQQFNADIICEKTSSAEARQQTSTQGISKKLKLVYESFQGIIGSHPLLLSALDLSIQVAPYSTSVLILGESGTGKERIAQAIHTISPRKNMPFIKVNCAAIPETLMESELFGHEKGAFTGAVEKRKGRFEQADGGTIFLDEIGELPLEMQVKLLRVLQEKEVDPIGGRSPIKVDVRVVAATSRNLEQEVAAGKFRLDLYYRLNVFPISLPPLRERKSDIPRLAEYFAQKFYNEFHKTNAAISGAMIEELCNYNWPGNIRELENVMERTVILHDEKGELKLNHNLSNAVKNPSGTGIIDTLADVKQVQQETERSYIISILKKAGGRIRGANGAAELLNIKPTTLESKMAKLGIKKEDLLT